VTDGGLRGLRAGNLPAALATLVGRQRELDTLSALLPSTRLLSLVGTGGCGKTRLAQAVSELAAEDFADGAWWVDLAGASGPGLVAAVVAGSLGVQQTPGEDPIATVHRHLRQRSALLVLDNCEHVADECAGLIEEWLRASPGLKVLSTSREVLAIPGERVFRVQGLLLAAPAGDAAESEAVALFVERARAIVPDFELTAAAAVDVARLCERLDGLPLAIELAAARVNVLGLPEIIDRLDEDVRVMRHPSRTAPARHQTLQSTLEWSHRLLAPREQALFRRLAAFQASFSLLAVESVCVGGDVERKHVVDLLAALVDKSLVQVADRGAEHRYRMLETVRQYAADKLAESGEQAETFAGHAAFFAQLAGQARGALEGADQARWLERLSLEHDNLRTVLRRSLPDRPEVGAHLAALLWPFWYRRGYYQEARSWLEEAVAALDATTPAVRAETLKGAGVLAFLQCDYDVAIGRLTAARDLFQREGDRVGLATSLQHLGSIAREQGRYGEARRLHEQSLAIWTELGDESGVAASEDYLGFAAWLEGDAQRAIDLCSRALAIFATTGRRQETAAARINLGIAHHLAGDDQAGSELLRAALNESRELGYQEGVAWSLHLLAEVAGRDDPDGAAAMLRESLTTHVGLGDRWRAASVLETIAETMLLHEDPEQATVLLGACGELRDALGTPVPPVELDRHLTTCRSLEAALGPAAFAEAWGRGQALGLRAAVEAALRGLSVARVPPARRPGIDYDLTEREVDVLRLVGQGLTNRQIGRELSISPGTAGVHVSNILRKLGVSGRVQAAGIAHQLGLGS